MKTTLLLLLLSFSFLTQAQKVVSSNGQLYTLGRGLDLTNKVITVKDSLLTNGSSTLTLRYDGVLKLSSGNMYGQGTSSRISMMSTGNGFNAWSGLSRFNFSPNGFRYAVGKSDSGDVATAFGFYQDVFAVNPDATAILGGGYGTKASASLGIGTNFIADSSAVLELVSDKKGFLPARMVQAKRLLIHNPAIGLQVYQTDGTEGLYQFKSSGWDFIH